MSCPSNKNKRSPSKTNEEKPDFEQSFSAELIYRMSDLSSWHIWPFLFLALACLGSVLVWYLKEDWPRFLHERDIVFVTGVVNFLSRMLLGLIVALVTCFAVFFVSLAVFIFLFFKRAGSKMLGDAVNILLANSFYFGISLIFVFFAALSWRSTARSIVNAATLKIQCAQNLRKIGRALFAYAEENHYSYPEPDSWCDSLVEFADLQEEDFICPAAKKGQSHYALNPDAEPVSKYRSSRKRFALRKLVLVFETESGWNQSGGPELLFTENHRGLGCNMLLNDGRVLFFRTQRFGDLRWKIEGDPSRQNP